MRVVAGSLGGRQFASPGNARTHPMSDKIRGALFNTLGDISGLKVLDAFSGSGALSFEALSRGAIAVTAIDIDPTAIAIVTKNAQELSIGTELTITRANALSWLGTTKTRFNYDLVLCDPPFNDVQPELVAKLAECVAPSGLLVVSLPAERTLAVLPDFTELVVKKYGDAQLLFWRRD